MKDSRGIAQSANWAAERFQVDHYNATGYDPARTLGGFELENAIECWCEDVGFCASGDGVGAIADRVSTLNSYRGGRS